MNKNKQKLLKDKFLYKIAVFLLNFYTKFLLKILFKVNFIFIFDKIKVKNIISTLVFGLF